LFPAASLSQQAARAQGPPPSPWGLPPASQRRHHLPLPTAPRPLNPSETPRTYPPVWSPPPTTYRAVSCETSRTASFATATPPPPRTGHTDGAALSSSHRRKSGALERTLFFVRFSFGLHPADESTFFSRSDRKSSGETSGRTTGLSSRQTLAPKTQLGTLLTVLLPVLQFLY